MSGYMVSDQKGTFEKERFLSVLSSKTRIRYMLYEHAKIEERRSSFREGIEKREISLTFEDIGINFPGLTLSKIAEKQNEIVFESNPIIFSGVSVIVTGRICLKDLTGSGKLNPTEEPPGLLASREEMSEEQRSFLRTRGLPIPYDND